MHPKDALPIVLAVLLMTVAWTMQDPRKGTRVASSRGEGPGVQAAEQTQCVPRGVPVASLRASEHLTPSQPGGIDATGLVTALHAFFSECP